MPIIINPSGQTITQHDALVGAANNVVSNIAPGTSGNVMTSNGTDWTSAAAAGGSATAFFSYASAPLSNVTGNNVIYDVIFNSTTRNDGTCYNTGTGVFTAPKTGLWSFTTILFLASGSTFTAGSEILVSSLGSVQSQILCLFGAAAARTSPDNSIIVAGAWMAQMTAGDTMQVQAFSSSALQDVSIDSNFSSSPLTTMSSFSGFLVG